MKPRVSFVLSILLSITTFIFSNPTFAGFHVNYIFAPTEIRPYATYQVTVGYTQQVNASELLLSLKNPHDNWSTYARAKAATDMQTSGQTVITIPVKNAPECEACVWELRVLPELGDPDSAAILQEWKSVSVRHHDEIIMAEPESLEVTPGKSLKVDLQYIASQARTLRVELISTQHDGYTGVILNNVVPGDREISVNLPIPENLSAEEEHYLSIKMTPASAPWYEEIHEICTGNLSIASKNIPGEFFWNFPLSNVRLGVMRGSTPNVTAYSAKIGTLTESVFADENLPFSGIEKGLMVHGLTGCCGQGYVLNLLTGELLQYGFDKNAEPNTPIEGSRDDFCGTGITGRYFIYQILSYSEDEDNSEYATAIKDARDMLQIMVNGYYEGEGFVQYQEAVDYLNAVLAVLE